jgi:hypothetical protein
MKTLLVFVLLVATSAYAGDVMVFRKGVEFNHVKHQSERVGICAVCHVRENGKIANFGKRWAHKNCIDCHDLYKEGPTGCGGCHSMA